MAASRVGSAAGTFLLPLIVSAHGVRAALAACVGVLAVRALVCYCWAPETRHLALSELDRLVPSENVVSCLTGEATR